MTFIDQNTNEPKTASRAKAETEARALGWMTETERYGVDDHHGVVHPNGHWAPGWASAVAFKSPAAA